jgi:F0F1-type ATP synthase assembly protein I
MAAPRKPNAGPETGMAMGQKYFAAGLRFAGGIVVFVLLGWLLDRWLETTPAFIVVGTIVGSVLSFLSVYRELVSDRRMSGHDGPDTP